MKNYWMENGMQPGTHVLVDCGYIAIAHERSLALRRHISGRNFQLVGNGRLVARIPPSKVTEVLEAFPQIKEGAHEYCWCTHGFIERELEKEKIT